MKTNQLINIVYTHRIAYVTMYNDTIRYTVKGASIRHYIDNMYDWHEIEDFDEEYKEASILKKNGYTVYKIITYQHGILFIRVNNKNIN